MRKAPRRALSPTPACRLDLYGFRASLPSDRAVNPKPATPPGKHEDRKLRVPHITLPNKTLDPKLPPPPYALVIGYLFWGFGV